MTIEIFKSISEITENYQNKLKNKNVSKTTFLSGFDGLDVITNGFQQSNLVIIGGADGMGKTSFAISLIHKMAVEKQYSVLFYSFQRSSQQILQSILSIETKIGIKKLQSETLDDVESELAFQKIRLLEPRNLQISDYPFKTVSDIEREMSYRPPDTLQILVIDSLHQIALNKNDKIGKVLNKKECTEIAFRLKEIAEQYNIVVIAILNIEKNKNSQPYYRPRLSDMTKQAPADSVADIVLLLYRPEYYKLSTWDDDEDHPTAGEAEIIIAKNNNGYLDNIRIKFDRETLLFDNFSAGS